MERTFISTLLFLGVCAFSQANIFRNPLNRIARFDPMHDECGAESSERQACGRRHDAIGKYECKARGCCFDDRDRVPAGTMRCYLAARMLKEECAVDYKQKDDCGYYGITEGECGDRDCCWKPSPRVNDPECFYPKKNNLRLMDYSTENTASGYGRVEVKNDEHTEWGTVCDDLFGIEEAQVICRQLGFKLGVPKIEAYYGQGTGEIYLDSMECDGSESNFDECDHQGWGSHDCSHGEDASVQCSNEEPEPTESPGGSGSGGDYWEEYEYRSQMKPGKGKGKRRQRR